MVFVYVVHPDGRHGSENVNGGEAFLGALQALVGGGDIASLPFIDAEKHVLTAYIDDEALLKPALLENPLAMYLVRCIVKSEHAKQVAVRGTMVLVSGKRTVNGRSATLTLAQIAELDAHFDAAKITVNDGDGDGAKRTERFAKLLGGRTSLCRRVRTELDDDNTKPPALTVYNDIAFGERYFEGSAFVEGGVSIKLMDGVEPPVYELTTTTFDAGVYTFSQYARVNQAGEMCSLGVYNAFGLGVRLMRDQASVDELIEELLNKIDGEPGKFWDYE